MGTAVEVLGLGNSLIDILSYADDDYLRAQEMAKGAMTLIDEERAEALYAARVDPRVISGGSAANTVVGVASFGVAAAYIGKVKRDRAGRDLRRRHPLDRRLVFNLAGRARARDRPLLHLCDARRRANDEHLSRRQHLSRAPGR